VFNDFTVMLPLLLKLKFNISLSLRFTEPRISRLSYFRLLVKARFRLQRGSRGLVFATELDLNQSPM